MGVLDSEADKGTGCAQCQRKTAYTNVEERPIKDQQIEAEDLSQISTRALHREDRSLLAAKIFQKSACHRWQFDKLTKTL